MRVLAGLAVVACVACGGGGGGGDDTQEAILELGGTTVGTTAFTFQGTRIGTQSTATFTLTNVGTAPSGAIVAQVTGDASFTVAGSSTCPGQMLDPGASCDLTLAFAPADVGPHAGTLLVAASPGGTISLDLGGEGQALGIVFDPATVDFGLVESGNHAAMVHVTNTTTDPLPISSIDVNGPVFSQTSNCGTSLAAGASCDITVQMGATQLGDFSATLTVDSAGQLTSAPVMGSVGGRITISKSGGGSGTITSNVGGINCGATCTAIVTGAVTLTVQADSGSGFLGWSIPGCGSATTCALPVDILPRTVGATFVDLTANSLSIQFAGNATGEAEVRRHINSQMTEVYECSGSCTVPVAAGEQIDLVAATPSTLVGWSGACSSTVSDCSFTITGNATATVTFNKDPKEQWTRLFLPDATVRTASYDSANRLVLGTTAGVIALDATGATRWTTAAVRDPADATKTVPAAGRVCLDANDNVFVIASHHVLAKLAPDGSFAWSLDLGGDADTDFYAMPRPCATSPNGDIAVIVGSVVKVYTTAGAPHWMSATLSSVTGSLAFDSTGNLNVLYETSSGETQNVYRFDANGAALSAPMFPIAPQYRASLVFDSTDSYVTSSAGHSHIHIKRTLADGNTSVFTNSLLISSPDYTDNDVVVGASDDIFSVYNAEEYATLVDGFVARRFTKTGTLVTTITRPRIVANFGYYGDNAKSIATDHQGKIAVVGQYLGITGNQAFVQTFAP